MKTPKFLKKITFAVGKSWASKGGVSLQAMQNEDAEDGINCTIIAYPAVRELIGGKQDGQTRYARFKLNINRFIKVFDKMPKITFDSGMGAAFVGFIDGVCCRIIISPVPPCGVAPSEVSFVEGPKKGTVEVREPPGEWQEESI